ncbi:DNA polymerase IV [compost metagenome]
MGIKLRFDDFRTVTRDLTMPAHTADGAAIRRGATECLKRIPLERRIRLLGVRVSALIPADEQGDDPAPVQEEFRFEDERPDARE